MNFLEMTMPTTKVKRNWQKRIQLLKIKRFLGGFYTIEIASILFGISIGIYTDNGNNEFVRYSFSENLKNDAKLMLLLFIIITILI